MSREEREALENRVSSQINKITEKIDDLLHRVTVIETRLSSRLQNNGVKITIPQKWILYILAAMIIMLIGGDINSIKAVIGAAP